MKSKERISIESNLNPNSNLSNLITNHKGITLIALIITIIVMLILVGVSITIAIKGDLFNITKRAAKETEKAKDVEQEVANGKVKIGEIWYDSIEDYVKGKQSENQTEPEKPVEPERPIEPESYLGRTATINGQKYIVLYEVEEEIQIEDYIYKVPCTELISANALKIPRLEDLTDWTNAKVIEEADINKNGKLDPMEDYFYTYNNIVKILNNKCEELVTINDGIGRVRSVGSCPSNSMEDSADFYETDKLEHQVTKGKGIDYNYETDYKRMKELGISVAENGEDYWLPSRTVNENDVAVAFCIRSVTSKGGILNESYWTYRAPSYYAFPKEISVRPVICVFDWALNDYLD